MVASVDRPTKSFRQGDCVKVPNGHRAYVIGCDPKDSDRVLIEYEARSLGEDSYPHHLLKLVCEAPEGSPPITKELPWLFIPNFLDQHEADCWLEYSEDLKWQQNTIKMFGKPIVLPRLEAIYGDGNYLYSGVTLEAQPWTDGLNELRKMVETETGYKFQIAIGNQYRFGSDHIGWHSDDSPEMGERPAIASLSLGATRKFQLRNKVTKEVYSFELTHGSLFIMKPGCQEEWHHKICKTSAEVGLRINWTFRPLVNESNPDPEQVKAVSQGFLVGDRVRPNWSAGTDKLGEVIEIRTKGKRKPQYWAVVKWLEGRTEAIGTTSQVRFDQLAKATESLALSTFTPEVIEAEIVPSDSEQLAHCEDEIEAGRKLCQQGERRVWLALHQIRDHNLWQLPKDEDKQPLYKSFEDYCLARHGWQKSNAHEVAGSGAVIAGLLDSGTPEADLPTSVAQIRELKKAPPAERLAVIQEVKAAGKLTAEAIKQAVQQRQPKLKSTPSDEYSYTPISPKPVQFEWFGKTVEGQAIATNRRGMVRVVYGENQESCIPVNKVVWLDLPTYKPSITPEQSQQDDSEPDPELPTVRLKVDQAKLAQIQKYLHGAIVQIGDTTFCLKSSDIRLEGL